MNPVSDRQLKVVIATGIYPPDIGGPANYAEKLASHLRLKGIFVSVVTYGALAKSGEVAVIPRALPYSRKKITYYRAVKSAAKDADVIIAFDDFSAALPAALAARALRKKFIIRLGGDFLWEKAYEMGATSFPIQEFYNHPIPLKLAVLKFVIDRLLRRAEKLIFSTEFQRALYVRNRGVHVEKTEVIPNPMEVVNGAYGKNGHSKSRTIVFAGRLIKVKNISRLISAFEKATADITDARLLIIGDGPERSAIIKKIGSSPARDRISLVGPYSRAELQEAIRLARFFVLPSVSDISPNVILDCLAFKIPFIITQETGLKDYLGDSPRYIDPQSEDDIALAMKELFDDARLRDYEKKLANIRYDFTWDEWLKRIEFELNKPKNESS